MECPKCKNNNLDYDSFEDMYRCGDCYLFYEPEEVGEQENRNARIFKLKGQANGNNA